MLFKALHKYLRVLKSLYVSPMSRCRLLRPIIKIGIVAAEKASNPKYSPHWHDQCDE